MIELVYGGDFVRSAKRLPKKLREKLPDLLDILQINPFHPLLHSKPLTGSLKGYFSFRITREWRVIFMFTNKNTILLIEVDHPKDIYR